MSSPYLSKPLRTIAEVQAQRARNFDASNAVHIVTPRQRDIDWVSAGAWASLFVLWFLAIVAIWAVVP